MTQPESNEAHARMTSIKHTYKFSTLEEAQAFGEKYGKVWFVSLPVQTQDGWEIRRYINNV